LQKDFIVEMSASEYKINYGKLDFFY